MSVENTNKIETRAVETEFPWKQSVRITLFICLMTIALRYGSFNLCRYVSDVLASKMGGRSLQGLREVLGEIGLLLGVGLFWLCRDRKSPIRLRQAIRLNFTVNRRWEGYPTGLWAGILVLALMLVYSTVTSTKVRSHLDWLEFITHGVGLALLAPPIEEILYRGYLLNTLCVAYEHDAREYVQQSAVRGAMIMSSFFFAVAHMEPGRMPELFLFGLGFAWLYRSSGSLYLPWLVHFAIDLNAFRYEVAQGLF